MTKEQRLEFNDNCEKLELEQLRKKKEFSDKVAKNLQVENKTLETTEEIEKYFVDKNSTRVRIKNSYKQNLDLCNQADAQIYSLENIYRKYLNGETLPIGALKNAEFNMENDFSDNDLTDLFLLNDYYSDKYGMNLDEAYQKAIDEIENDDELNDDEQDKSITQKSKETDFDVEFPKEKTSKKGAEGDA